MTQRVAFLEGKNQVRDSDFSKFLEFFTSAGVAEGLEVQENLVTSGYGFIDVTRSGKTFRILFESTEDVVIDTSGTKKVFIEVEQANIDDGLSNNIDGTGIASIKTAASYPAGNFIKLASITSGVITDERVTEILKLGNLTQDLLTSGNISASTFFGDGSNLTGLTAEVDSTSKNYMLGTAGVVGKAYSLVDYEQTGNDSSLYFGRDANPLVGQSFFAQSVEFTNISISLKKIGNPDDNVFVQIQEDTAGYPNGTVVTNGVSNNISYTEITGTITEKVVTFSSAPVLVEGQKYHVVVRRSGANSEANYYEVGRTFLTSTFIGGLKRYNGSWYGIGGDLFVKIPGYKLAVLGGSNFIGICQLTGSAGDIVKFNTSYDSNQSGLTPGNFYGYDSGNGDIVEGGKLKAISESELSFSTSSGLDSNQIEGIYGESISSGDPVRFGAGIVQYDYDATYTNEVQYGYNTTYQEIVQSVTLDSDTVLANFSYWDRNDDNTGTGSWRRTHLAVYSDLACTQQLKYFGFLENIGMTATRIVHDGQNFQMQSGVTYYFRIWSDNVSTSYFHYIRYNTGNPHSGGTAYRRDNTGATFDLGGDLQFAINFGIDEESSSQIFRSYADIPHKAKSIGIAQNSGDIGDRGTILTGGVYDLPVSVKKVGVATGVEGDTSGTAQEYFYGAGPGQKFTLSEDGVINGITLYNGGNTRTYEYRLYKDGVFIANTNSSQTLGIVRLDFSSPIPVLSGDTYEVRIVNIQDSVQKSIYYNASDVYVNGNRTTPAGADTTGDLYFQIHYTKMIPVSGGDKLYVNNEGKISGFKGDYPVSVGNALSSSKMKINLILTSASSVTVSRSTTSASDTITYTHGLGKVPSQIIVNAIQSYVVRSDGAWSADGTNKCIFIDGTSSSDYSAYSDGCIVIQDTSNRGQIGRIKNVTDSSFDVEWVYTPTPSASTIWAIFTILD